MGISRVLFILRLSKECWRHCPRWHLSPYIPANKQKQGPPLPPAHIHTHSPTHALVSSNLACINGNPDVTHRSPHLCLIPLESNSQTPPVCTYKSAHPCSLNMSITKLIRPVPIYSPQTARFPCTKTCSQDLSRPAASQNEQ